MADIQPFRALRYDPEKTGGLQDVVSPPYDVIDAEQRAELTARSPYNVVNIDLPQGDDPYEHAKQQFDQWRADGVIVEDDAPALWVLAQDYVGPDGSPRTRTGFLARVRVTEYGPGTIRPHERTHPGPREDRLRLTRATKANLSPIFSLYSDESGQVDTGTRRSEQRRAVCGRPRTTTGRRTASGGSPTRSRSRRSSERSKHRSC